ncbi:MAG: helix-turn-helix domain-containing protein [Oenococcus sp.]|uniref:helix-turn-helix domain-containing protein n=1 Tax=Oenococcus sp. TaxID=1979414 RepID=UPI0039EC909D
MHHQTTYKLALSTKQKQLPVPSKVSRNCSQLISGESQTQDHYKTVSFIPIHHWLNTKQASNYLGISQPTLRKMRQDKLFTAHQYGRRFLYSKSELDAAIEHL